MISSVATYIIGSWYDSNPTVSTWHGLRSKLPKLSERRTTKHCSSLPASVKSPTLPQQTRLWPSYKALYIAISKWLPSGIRLSFQYCRTNWHKDTAVPSFIRLFNEYVTRSCQDGWMNGVLGHFFALSRLNWAGDNLDNPVRMNLNLIHNNLSIQCYIHCITHLVLLNTSQHHQNVISILDLNRYFL